MARVGIRNYGFELFEKGLAVNPESLQPVYLRMPQAERERLQREKSGDS